MDIEDRSRDAVGEDRRPEPSAQVQARVMAALPARDGAQSVVRRFRLPDPRSLRLVAAPMGVALVVALAVVLTLGPRLLTSVGRTGTEASAFATTAGSGSAETPTAGGGLARHVAIDDFGFDVPSGWTTRVYEFPFSINERLFRDLPDVQWLNSDTSAPLLTAGTGRLDEQCANPTPEQMLSGLRGAICKPTWELPAGGVQLRLDFDARDGVFQGCCKGIYSAMTAATEHPPAGSEAIMLGGLEARVTRVQSNTSPLTGETIPGADEVLVYRLVAPQWTFFGYVVTVALRGPNLPELEDQVTAVMGSLRYTPAITPLPTDAVSLKRALHSTLSSLDGMNSAGGVDQSVACFLDMPGATNTATITKTVFISNRQLQHPLKVRCMATIQATPVDYWLVKLTYEWDATGKYRAGTASQTYLVARDFQTPMGVASQAAPTNEDAMPYIAPAHPYNPG